MAQNETISLKLDLNSDSFNKGLSAAGASLKTITGAKNFVQLGFEVGDLRIPFQAQLKNALDEMERLKALSYTTKGGKKYKVKTLTNARGAYRNFTSKMDAASSKRERDKWLEKAYAVEQYLSAVSGIGIVQRAMQSGQNSVIRQQAYWQQKNATNIDGSAERAESQHAKEIRNYTRAEDRRKTRVMLGYSSSPELALLRQNYEEQNKKAKAEEKEWQRMLKEEEKAEAAKRKAEEDRRKAENRRYNATRVGISAEDRRMNRIIKGGSSSPELALLRQQYIEEDRKARKEEKRRLQEEQRKAKEEARLQREQEREQQRLMRQRVAEQNKLNKSAENFSKALGRQSVLMSGLGSMARRYLNIFMISNVIQRIAEMTGYFQQQQVALEGILGSASKAQSVLNSAKVQALKSPFTTQQIVGNVKQIAAYGIPAEDLVPTAKMLGDLSAGLGVDMNRLILAYGQVKSASVLRGQELRQFTEAGVPMVQKLADKFSELNGRLVTTGDVFELISKRQVPFEMVAEVLRDMTSEGGQFYNMQENVMDTLYGQIGKLKDMWTLSLNDIGTTAGKTLMRGVKLLQSVIQNFAFVLGTVVSSSILRFLVSPMTIFLSTMSNAISRIGVMKAALLGLRHVFRAANLAIFGIKAAVTAVSIAFGALINKIVKSKEFEKGISRIELSFAKDTAKMVNGLDLLIGKIQTFASTSKMYKDAISSLVSNYGDYIDSSMVSKIEEIADVKKRADAWKELSDNIKLAIEARKDYERHETIQQESGEKAVNKHVADILENLALEHSESTFVAATESYATSYDAIGLQLKNKNAEYALSNALTSFYNSGSTDPEKLESLLRSQAKAYGLTEEVTEALAGNAEMILEILKKTKEWSRYLAETEALQNDPHTIINNTLKGAKESVLNGDLNLKDSDVTYMKSAIEVLKTLEQGTDSFVRIANADWNAERTHDFAVALDELARATADEGLKENINFLKKQFVELAGTRTGVAADIATKIMKNVAWDEDFKKFALRYLPSDATLEELRTSLKSRYDTNKGTIKSHSSNPSEAWTEQLKSIKKEQEWIKRLAMPDLFDIDLSESKKTRGNTGDRSANFRRLFSDMFSLIKEAKKEQEKLIGVTGTTETMLSAIGSEEGSKLLKDFYTANSNPFKTFIDKINEYDEDGNKLFSANDFESLKTRFIKLDGKNMSVANYEQIWNDLIKIIDDKIKSIDGKAGMEKTVQALSKAKDDAIKEWIQISGRDKTDNLIKKAITELQKISNGIEQQKAMSDYYERIKTVSGYDVAGKAMYGYALAGYKFDSVSAYQNGLLNMLGTENVGIDNALGGRLTQFLRGAKLTISSLPKILEYIQMIKDFEYTGPDNGKEEFSKVKQQFTENLKSLADAIMEQRELLEKSMTPFEKKSLEYKKLLDDFHLFAKILENSDLNLDTKRKRGHEMYYSLQDNIDKLFGGTGDIFRIPGEDRNMQRVALLGGLSGQLSPEQIMGNRIGEKLRNGEIDAETASKMQAEFSSKINLIEAIIKAVYESIKAIVDTVNATVDAMKATNKVSITGIDAAGNVSVERNYSEERLDRAKKDMEIIQTYNQHVMDGWNKFKSGDFLGAIFEVFSSITDLIKSISERIDMAKTQQQDYNNELIAANNRLRQLYQWQQNYVAGMDKWTERQKEINSLLEDNEHLQENIELETSKKAGDSDKIQDYQDQITENNRTIVDAIREMKEELVGTADELANTLGDALVQAFRNGENAARAWRDAVKSYIGDAIKTMLIQKYLAPQLENILDQWMYGFEDIVDENGNIIKNAESQASEAAKKNGMTLQEWMSDRLTNTGIANKVYKDLTAQGTAFADVIENLPDTIQDFLKYNSDTAGLGGGIESITEDTARRIEALSNAQLGEVYSINTKMTTIQSDIAKTTSNVAMMLAIMNDVTTGVKKFNVSVQ